MMEIGGKEDEYGYTDLKADGWTNYSCDWQLMGEGGGREVGGGSRTDRLIYRSAGGLLFSHY